MYRKSRMIFTFSVCDALVLYTLKVGICTQLPYIVFLTKEKKIQRKEQAKLYKTEMPFSLIFQEFPDIHKSELSMKNL